MSEAIEPGQMVRVFLSCVTKEFGEPRALLKTDLSLPGVVVREQLDFVDGGGTLVEKLDAYIRNCDAVIHIVGRQVGSTLKSAEAKWLQTKYPDFLTRFPFLADDLHAADPPISYTQIEAWLALYHGRRCHKYRPRELIDTPLPSGDPQQRHWDRLRALGEDRGGFDDPQYLCRRVLRALHDLFPAVIPKPICQLSYRSLGQLFIGRDGDMATLRQQFQRARDGGHWPAQIIHGLGGVGKTQLAIEYAWRYRDHYAAVFLIKGDSRDALERELAGLAGVFDAKLDPAMPQPEQIALALAWLARHPGWLLIVDNVDTEEARNAVLGVLPKWADGHVVITGRVRSWPPAVQPLDLHVLHPADAARFILEATQAGRLKRPDDADQAPKIADDLGYLCLALQQAAAYINELQVPLADYRQRWSANKANVRAWADKIVMQYHADESVSLSVATTWQTTFDQLTPAAKALLEMLSFLAPDPLPRDLLLADETTDQLRTLSGDPTADAEMALAQLRRYSLLTDPRQPTFESSGEIHRLVQLFTREKLSAEVRQRTLTATLAAVNDYAPTDCYDVRTWPVLTPLQSHLAELTDHASAAKISAPTTRLLSILGGLLQEKSMYASAEPPMRRALAIDEASLGPEHPNVAIRLNNLAQLLKATNRLADAEPLMRRALAIDEASFGPEHPNVAIDLNNLATLFQSTNRLAEAEPLMRRALAIDEASFGPEHPNVATDLNNLAQLLKTTNRLAEAEPLMRRVISIFETSLGSGHPNVAAALNNLALLLQDTNRLAEAEPLMRRALAIDEASFGPEHPNIADDLNNLAALLQATNRLAEAEPLMRRALVIDEASLGPEHPRVAIHLNNLAQLLQATNRLAEAEPLMRRALAIDEASFGPEHPNVATDLNNLAQLLQATNRLAEAEPLMRRALAIDEASFGSKHPKVAIRLNNLATLLQDTNRLAEAEPLMRRALAIDEASFGPEHPNVAIRLNNLATLLQDTNRLAEAEPLMRRALAIDEASFGPEHPNVARDLNNLALLLQDTNRLAEAEPLMRRALAIGEASFGPEHPNVARDLNNLARLLQDTNRLAEAEPLMRRAVEITVDFRRATGHEHPKFKTCAGNYSGLLAALGRTDAEIAAELARIVDGGAA